MPNAMVTYKKPPSLRTALVNAKELAYETTNQVIPGTFACGSCALCGNFGRYKGHNMILEDGMVRVSSTGKRLRLHQRLTCRNFGIYLATCIIDNCGKQYVGQTKNSFRERWGGHRSQWKKSATSDTDAAAEMTTHEITPTNLRFTMLSESSFSNNHPLQNFWTSVRTFGTNGLRRH